MLSVFTSVILIFSIATASASEIVNDLKSPWRKDVRDWVLGGAIATGLLVAFEKQIVDPTQQELNEDKPLGPFAKIGDYGGRFYPNAIYSLGMLGAYWATGDKKYGQHSWVMFKASAYAISASTLLKYTIHENRPNGDNNQSFPSGHATSAFAFATTVIARHDFFPYGVSALALATLTAVSRMNDNYHYLHDVVAGATIGTAFGLGVGRQISEDVQVVPVYSRDLMGIAVAWSLN